MARSTDLPTLGPCLCRHPVLILIIADLEKVSLRREAPAIRIKHRRHIYKRGYKGREGKTTLSAAQGPREHLVTRTWCRRGGGGGGSSGGCGGDRIPQGDLLLLLLHVPQQHLHLCLLRPLLA